MKAAFTMAQRASRTGLALAVAALPAFLRLGHSPGVPLAITRAHPGSVAALSETQVVLEDFEAALPGGIPEEWEWKGWEDVTEKPYWVAEESGNRFLRAEDTGQNVILLKKVRWNLRDYPYISWRWRIRAVPAGADERYEERADSAAGVYLTYRRKMGLVPQSLKFVWSSSLPVGAAFRRNGIGMPWTIVAGSGEESLNEWHRAVFDALASYRETFGGAPPQRPLGIGILSDANNTRTRAFADYDDFIVLREAESLQRIERLQPNE